MGGEDGGFGRGASLNEDLRYYSVLPNGPFCFLWLQDWMGETNIFAWRKILQLREKDQYKYKNRLATRDGKTLSCMQNQTIDNSKHNITHNRKTLKEDKKTHATPITPVKTHQQNPQVVKVQSPKSVTADKVSLVSSESTLLKIFKKTWASNILLLKRCSRL